jgi:hypothetical protein
MEEEAPPPSSIAAFAGGVTGLASAVLLTWWTVIAFVGGRMPLIGIETEGGVGLGLLWLFVIDPIAATVLYWISIAVVLPVVGVGYAARRR